MLPMMSFRSRMAALLLAPALLAACTQAQPAPPTQAPANTTAPAAPTQAPATAAPTTTSAPTAAPTAAATATPADVGQLSDEQIKAGIQETLDLYAKAYNEGDGELLKQAVDQKNVPFRRLVQGRFETFQESINAGRSTFAYSVGDITRRDLGFIQAQVLSNGTVRDWLFRLDGGRWVISEPTEKQIGKRVTTETDNFVFYTYPWADDINSDVMQLMEQARDIVKQKLGKIPEQKAEVLIKPIFSLPPPENANVLAYYKQSTRAGVPDRMVIMAPHSFAFGGYDEARGWQGELLTTLAHEYTHLVNNRSFTPIARMSDWMVEGLAEYVSDPEAPLGRGVPTAVQTDQIIPLVDTSGAFNKQDLEHLTILDKDVSLAYGLANTLVAYINEQYGGMDGFWKLVANYDKQQNLDSALQSSFGIGLEQFEADWHAWLKQKYG
jgi:hypothetical protein